MKRKELEKKLMLIAKRHGQTTQWSEGGNYSKVRIGRYETIVPRHREINELTAKGIIKYFEKELSHDKA